MSTVVLVGATVANGLLAGLFFAFSCAVTAGLHRVEDRTYVTVFRATNTAILNGWFLPVFLGAPLLTLAAAALRPDGRAWLVAALVGTAGTFLVTVARNVPLNQRLARATTGTAAQWAEARRAFEGRWNGWNAVRTGTSTGALVCLAAAAAG